MSAPVIPDNQEQAIISEPAAKSYGRVTARAIVLALILMVINDYWIVQLEVVRYSFATYAAPFYNCIFTLFVVTLANVLVRRVWPRAAFSRVELITIYIMLSISSAVCSHNMMEILVSLMGYAHYFKTPENQWGKLFADHLPHWLTVSDPESLKYLYKGNSSLYIASNYKPWIIPVLCWSGFCAVLLSTMLCINTIMRKQWIESERLTFAIVMLPLDMTAESGDLFKNKHMWMGFAVAGGLTFLAGLNHLYPTIPCFHIARQNVGKFLTTPPWNAIGGINIAFYFWAIGIAFLMPLELSFSCWFFFWITRMEIVGSTVFGLNDLRVTGSGFDNAFPFLTSQSYGAYVGFFVMSMWTSRKYLRRVLRTAFLGTKEEDESREPISYRAAIMGVLGGFALLAAFADRMGMSAWVIILFFTFYFIFALIISRIRAELGFPTHDMHVMGPQNMLMTVAGTQNLGKANLIGFSLFYWFNRTYASHPSPHQLESFKLAERTNTAARGIFFAALIAGIVAMPMGFWMLLHTYYIKGGATANMEQWALGFGREAWNNLQNWTKQPLPGNPTSVGFVGVGFIISMLLGWARVRFLWFPFHPLAYAISNSWGVYQLWCPLLIGSTAKFITLKFGGLGYYRKALPFFYGLILGEIVVGSLWTIYGIVFNIPTYDFWPGPMV